MLSSYLFYRVLLYRQLNDVLSAFVVMVSSVLFLSWRGQDLRGPTFSTTRFYIIFYRSNIGIGRATRQYWQRQFNDEQRSQRQKLHQNFCYGFLTLPTRAPNGLNSVTKSWNFVQFTALGELTSATYTHTLFFSAMPIKKRFWNI